MEGKREMVNIPERAMLMLCSSAGGTHSDFCACGRRCRHISAAFMSCSERSRTLWGYFGLVTCTPAQEQRF
jgi:hypothetical protein